MKTTKPPKQSQVFSVEFVTPLSLETCLKRLQRYDRSGVLADAKRIDDNTYTFEIWSYEVQRRDKKASYPIRGYLQRWDDNAVLVRGGMINNYRYVTVMSLIITVVVVSCIATPIIATAGIGNISPIAWVLGLLTTIAAIGFLQVINVLSRAHTMSVVKRVFGDVGFRPESYDSRLDPLKSESNPAQSNVDDAATHDEQENYFEEKRQLRDSNI